MKVDSLAFDTPLAAVGAAARAAEDAGDDGWFTAETSQDPFITVAVAAQATERIEIGTGIAVAFARNPMDVAYSANDLQLLSGGRFVLGLGSQIEPHITRRFSMPWSSPAARMREFVLAMRAIWSAWHDGAELDFRGDFYEHTLLPPFFAPGPNPYGPPPVLLAAVGPRMTTVAGEVADGVLAHAFTTEAYLREVTLPALAEGAARADRDPDDVHVAMGLFVVSGYDAEERAASEAFVRGQLGFYASTPAYRPVLERHGWGDRGDELTRRSRAGEWQRMPELVDDEMLDAFAVVAAPDELADRILGRYGDVVDRVSLYTSFAFRDGDGTAFREALAAAGTAPS
ncbi:MAG: TIGR03617 family F420-dependent LLM class oxidoreductase [Actinobacteria bacterium]|nr:TIGR03617 family F420-dependent LLM class oxidoreductase [Actinomycetota bacterium]